MVGKVITIFSLTVDCVLKEGKIKISYIYYGRLSIKGIEITSSVVSKFISIFININCGRLCLKGRRITAPVVFKIIIYSLWKGNFHFCDW